MPLLHWELSKGPAAFLVVAFVSSRQVLFPKMARILVIDDTVAVRELLEEMLRMTGHEVVVAANGKEGLDQLRRQPVELVITDLFMPEKEGLETIRELRRDFPNIGIIAMSGEPGMPSLLGIAKRFGALKTIEKPFDRTEMMAAVEEVLKSKPSAQRDRSNGS